MKEIWKGEPQFSYDYGEYGHYYTPVVRHHQGIYYGSRQHLGNRRVDSDTGSSLTFWEAFKEQVKCIFVEDEGAYERYITEESTFVFDSKAHAIAFMNRNGLNMEEAARLTERVEEKCP